MIRLRGAIVACVLLSSGCATPLRSDKTDAVNIYLPSSRLELPEPAPRRFGASMGLASATALVLTSDQANREPSTVGPDFGDYEDIVGRLDWQPLEAGLVSMVMKGDGMPIWQLKWHARRPRSGDALSAAVTVGYGAASDTVTDRNGAALTSIRHTVRDTAVIFGYPIARRLRMFGGPFFSATSYQGDYTAERGADPDVALSYSGKARQVGVNAGLAFELRSGDPVLVEVSVADTDAGTSNRRVFRAAVARYFFFGRAYDSRSKTSAAARSPERTAPSM